MKAIAFTDPRIRTDYRGKHRQVLISFGGCTLSASRWGMRLGITGDVILMRLRRGMTVEQALSSRRYERAKVIRVKPIRLPDGMTPELAAATGLIDADQYLDFFRVPRRPWGLP